MINSLKKMTMITWLTTSTSMMKKNSMSKATKLDLKKKSPQMTIRTYPTLEPAKTKAKNKSQFLIMMVLRRNKWQNRSYLAKAMTWRKDSSKIDQKINTEEMLEIKRWLEGDKSGKELISTEEVAMKRDNSETQLINTEDNLIRKGLEWQLSSSQWTISL